MGGISPTDGRRSDPADPTRRSPLRSGPPTRADQSRPDRIRAIEPNGSTPQLGDGPTPGDHPPPSRVRTRRVAPTPSTPPRGYLGQPSVPELDRAARELDRAAPAAVFDQIELIRQLRPGENRRDRTKKTESPAAFSPFRGCLGVSGRFGVGWSAGAGSRAARASAGAFPGSCPALSSGVRRRSDPALSVALSGDPALSIRGAVRRCCPVLSIGGAVR